MDIPNNYNLKKDSKFLKITTGVVAITLAVGLSNEYFKSITSNHNTYSFAAAPEASSSSGVIASGNCGEEGHEADVTWELTQNEGSDTYTLTISGNGKMADYFTKDNALIPWSDYEDKITKLVATPGVTYIGTRSFGHFKSLTEIDLSHVKKIGDRAFITCKSLKEVKLLEVEEIGEGAFFRCHALETVMLPKVKTINKNTFYECIALKNVELPEVKEINENAFENCRTLGTVNIPKIRKIGNKAFRSCLSLRKVIMPPKDTVEMDPNAFLNCVDYEFEAVPIQTMEQSGDCGATENDHVTWKLDKNSDSDTYTLTISGQGKMKDYKWLDGGRVNTEWFGFRDKITKVVVTPDVTYIGCYAFFDCNKLETVDIPNVKEIGKEAFNGCSSLENIDIPEVETINSATFYMCKKLETIPMPNVQTIRAEAFYSCSSLKTVDIPNVKEIGDWAFAKCNQLRTVTMPNVREISHRAFDGCSSLETVEIPKVKTIGKLAFHDCQSLKEVYMPEVETIGIKAFEGCPPNLKFETVSVQTPQQASADETQNHNDASSSTDNQNVDLDDDEDNEDDGNILLDKELTDIEPLETPQEVATETTETVEPSPTTATTTNTKIPNTGAQNNGLLAAMLTTLGGALGLISKKHRENS